eukprot:550643-Amphidinium_carterae.1
MHPEVNDGLHSPMHKANAALDNMFPIKGLRDKLSMNEVAINITLALKRLSCKLSMRVLDIALVLGPLHRNVCINETTGVLDITLLLRGLLRCIKYHPQTGNSIYVGRTYDVIRDFHDDGAGPATHASSHYQLPLAKLKMIQQLMVTKTNVCPHTKAGRVVASVDHLGLYRVIVPIENLVTLAQYTNDNSWVEMKLDGPTLHSEAQSSKLSQSGDARFQRRHRLCVHRISNWSDDEEGEGPAIIDIMNPTRDPTMPMRLNPGNVEALQNDMTTARNKLDLTDDMLRDILQQQTLDPQNALQNLLRELTSSNTPAVERTSTRVAMPASTPNVIGNPVNTSSCAKIPELEMSDKPERVLSPHALWSTDWWSSILTPQHYPAISLLKKVGAQYVLTCCRLLLWKPYQQNSHAVPVRQG